MVDGADVLAARLRPSRQDGSYPRPTLVRRRWASLDGPAGYAVDDEGVGLRDRWWERDDHFDQTITLPFPPESQASGIADTRPHPVVWYRITLTPSQLAAAGHEDGRRLLLHFGGVDYHAIVWVDGVEAGAHEGGQSPFTLDITDELRGEGPHRIVVRAWDAPHDRSQPRGKQTWEDEPAGIWYQRSTGIWRPVWVESVPPVHVRRVIWRTPASQEAVTAVVELNRRPRRPVPLRVGLAHRGRPIGSAATLAREQNHGTRRDPRQRRAALGPGSPRAPRRSRHRR